MVQWRQQRRGDKVTHGEAGESERVKIFGKLCYKNQR